MKFAEKIFWLAVIVFCSAAQAAWPAPQTPDQPRRQTQSKQTVLVGRISLIEGELLRYVHEAKDWVLTVKDTPFGREDALYSGENSEAEFLMPNNTWIRIGANTQIQMIALKEDATEVDVAAGMARLINRSSKVIIKATTPFGYAIGAPGSAFDLYVGEESVEVVAIKGKVEFIHDVDGAKYNVIPGSISILADNRQAAAGEGKVDTEWDKWNNLRDSILVNGLKTKGQSVNHLPDGIREDSGVLDENGRWEKVYYDGEYREAWRPTNVKEDWAPYTVGHWTDWYGDYTWVPYEPFGYVTHHYGFWFLANDCWYWAPPAVAAGWDFPRWGIGFGWYPGRVGWLYSEAAVGWFPLLPWEPYYAFNWWGPWGFTVYKAGLINVSFNRYSNWNRSVIVNQTDFHNVNSYSQTRLTNVSSSAIVSGFKAAPVVNSGVLKNAGDPEQRFNYTKATPQSKPAQNVTSRVAQNQAKFRQMASSVNGGTIRNQAAGAKLAKPEAVASRVSAPKISSGKTGTARSQALNRNPRASRPSTARRALSGRTQAGQTARGRGIGVTDRSGAAARVRSQRQGGPATGASAAGQRADGLRSMQGHRTVQNRNEQQRLGQRPSRTTIGAGRGAGGQSGGAPNTRGRMGGGSRSERSPARARPGGSAHGMTGPRGGGGHGGARH